MPRKAANTTATASKPRLKAKTPAVARRRGRPTKYLAQKHCAEANAFSLLGLTNLEIAEQFGIPEQTLQRWKNEKPEFREAIESGGPRADGRVVVSLYKRATGDVAIPAVKIFYDKDKGEPVYAPYVERLPPDVNAARLWLFNRQSARWRDRKEVEVSGSLEHRISQMTPEQRIARLLELQAKAALIIDGEATEVEPKD